MLVTAICPTYNRWRWIPSVIACFLAQTFDDSELLIVDDGTEEPPSGYVPSHSRIRYVKLYGERIPTGQKRNMCCELAHGEFIVHFDNDDYSAPQRIEHQVVNLEASETQVLGYSNLLYWDELSA